MRWGLGGGVPQRGAKGRLGCDGRRCLGDGWLLRASGRGLGRGLGGGGRLWHELLEGGLVAGAWLHQGRRGHSVAVVENICDRTRHNTS